MVKVTVGKIIRELREIANVSQETLGRGICTVPVLSRYESGESIPDALSAHMLLQRLGVSPGRMNFMMSAEEGMYFRWKQETIEAVKYCKWENVERLLTEKLPVCNLKLQTQYENYLRAAIGKNTGASDEETYSWIENAIKITMPMLEKDLDKNIIISADEWNLFFFYLEQKRKIKKVSLLELEQILRECREKIEENVVDEFEKQKIFPRFVCMVDRLLENKISIKKKVELEEQAFRVLVKWKGIYDMPEILRILIRDKKSLGCDTKRYEKQRKALVHILEYNGNRTEFRTESWYSGNESICVIHEYLSMGRREKQICQMQLSDGICEPETYSRIERGRRKPSKKNLMALLERLEIGWAYYRSQIVTVHFSDLELMTEQRRQVVNRNWDEAAECIKKLKKSLDMGEVENRQYIGMCETICNLELGKISEGQALAEYQRDLEKSVTDLKKMKRFLNKTEIELAVQIGGWYRKHGKLEESRKIFELILLHEDEKIYASWNETGLVRRCLAGVYSDLAEYNRSTLEAQKCICEMIRYQSAQMLAECIYMIGWNLEKMGEGKEICEKVIRDAFYLNELYENKNNSTVILKHYQKVYGNNNTNLL